MGALRLAFLGAWIALAGCQAPGTIAPGSDVHARLELHAYRLQTLLGAYTAASIDHVQLTLLRESGGSYVPTGAGTTVPAAALGQSVDLGNLKLASQYRIQADAYADAAGQQLISVPGASTTDFSTPAVKADPLGDTMDDTPIALVSLQLALSNQPYAGQAGFVVACSQQVLKRASTVMLQLFDGTAAVAQETLPVASVSAGQTLTLGNLRMGTTYKVEAAAYDASGRLISTTTKSTLSFSTPALSGGTIDTQVNASPYQVPCS